MAEIIMTPLAAPHNMYRQLASCQRPVHSHTSDKANTAGNILLILGGKNLLPNFPKLTAPLEIEAG